MEVPYIFVILTTIITLVYVYAHQAFAFADRGVDYLTSLSLEDSDKLNNDPKVMEVLNKRDLPNMSFFAGQRDRVKSLLVVAIVINLINYAIYPYDILLYSWMQYIIVVACIATSFDGIMMFFTLRKNKQTVSSICNAYYDLTLAHDEVEEVVASVDKAFNEMMQDLNKVITTVEDKNKNGDDEK